MRRHAPATLAVILGLTSLLPVPEAHANAGVVLRQAPAVAPQGGASKPMRNRLAAPADRDIRVDTAPDARLSGASRSRAAAASARAFGSFGIPYTSVRVQDGPAAASASQANRLSTTYPYRTIGRLDFATPDGSSWCSASLIMRSVLLTAAHCVADFGSNDGFFGGWTFRPGFYGPEGASTQQEEPYGAWNAEYVTVAQTWLNGKDSGVGSARNNDLAVFIIGKNGSNQFIGDQVGWMTYGWNNYSFTRSAKTRNTWTAATATLGYPFNMDFGTIMQRADGPTFLTNVRNARQMWQGTNFTGGSSGGPWVVNFGFSNANLNDGATPGTASFLNVVVGVTSWGSSDPNVIKDNYSSQFGQNREFPAADYGGYGAGNIGALLQTLCTAVKPGSGQTYAQLGYCDK